MKHGLHIDGRKCGPIDPNKVNEEGWSWYDTEDERDAAVVISTEELRAAKAEEIKQHSLSLIQSRIPAIDSYEMVAFMRVLWPTLTDPALQPDLAYARDVYLYAVDRLTDLETATREQIEGYAPEDDPNWPA